MEEKKINNAKTQKLSYEQLEAYAAQTTEQATRVLKENQVLKRALYDQNLKEVEVALKCLDHADKFSIEFIDSIVQKIEEMWNPAKAQGNDKEEEEV